MQTLAKESQAKRILRALKDKGYLYNYEMSNNMHILMYVTRIYELRHECGETIVCERVEGRPGVFKYTLLGELEPKKHWWQR